MSGAILQARGLKLRFGRIAALDGVDLDIWPGEVVAIVGESGSGKTTLLRVLSGLMPPTSGEVTVGGVKVTEPLGEIGLVFQDYRGSLMPWMRTLENVAFPLQGRGVPRRERNETAQRWLDARQADLLASGEHPDAYFVARNFVFDGEALREVRGEITLRGISRPLSLRALGFSCGTHPLLQREWCGGDFEAELRRSDFGMSFGLPLVADRVRLQVQVEAIRD